MHLLVTDRLVCPHCGPQFGLILVAERLENRRILDGFFGCSNCQARYPVREGFGDLRPPSGGKEPGVLQDSTAEGGAAIRESRRSGSGQAEPDPELPPEPTATSLAAFLGLTSGSGFLLLTGRSVRHAAGLSEMGDGFEVVAAHPSLANAPESEGVSRVRIGTSFPFRTGSLRGVVLEGPIESEFLREGRRVLAPASRLVLLTPGKGGRAAVEEAGLSVIAGDENALVGALK